MFIRETIKTIKEKKYIQHKLIESIRTPFGPRQKVILNLGILDLEKNKWKDLANSIEAILHGQAELFSNKNEEINKLAEHYVSLIINNQLNKTAKILSNKNDNNLEVPEYENVDINSIRSTESRSIGAEHLVLNQLKEYKFENILKLLNFNEKQICYVQMLIAARMIHPASERETVRWINENSGICELLNTEIKVYDNALHRTAVLLLEKKDEIEKKLADAAREKFSLKETIILYDLTNTYFEGQKLNSAIAKRGRSKEKRTDCPLITLALTVDEQGFPKQSRILEGNVGENTTLEKMLDEISNFTIGFNQDKTIVIDAGIASEDNIKLIKRKGFKYIAVKRNKNYDPAMFIQSPEKIIDLPDNKAKLKVKLAKTEDEAYLLCYSEKRAAKENAILQNRIKKFELALKQINENFSKKRTQKKYDKIIERIGRLKKTYKVGFLYDIEVIKKNNMAVNIIFKKNSKAADKEQCTGEYIIRTNRMDLNEEKISKIHRSLTTIEDSFKCMKSELGMRPNYHKKDKPTIAHIFITVLAYHIISGILKILRNNGITYTWNTIRNILSTHVRVTTSLKTKNQDVITVRDNVLPSLCQREIYNNLGIKHSPLKKLKNKISFKNKNCSDEKTI